MQGSKLNMNAIYISERVQECLCTISESVITTVSAPMGYGKTTAINWFLNGLNEQENKVIRISIYSNNLNLFWQSVQRAFWETNIGECLEQIEFPMGDTAIGLFSELLYNYLVNSEQNHYLFVDDYHLMSDYRVMKLFLTVTCRMPANFHLIISSRDVIISRREELLLGNHLHQISANDLRLNPTELSIYSRRCGVSIEKQKLMLIDKISEGWFAAIYLNLKAFSDHGILLTKGNDIFEMMNDTLLISLKKKEKIFLYLMSLSDEFTIEQASYITELTDTIKIARKLVEKNAFVRLLPDGKTYRFHHMLKECTKKQFEQLSKEEQHSCYLRYGVWFESQKEYIQAISYYLKAEENVAILHLIGLDRGVQLASSSPTMILDWLEKCSEEELMQDPRGLLVLMRRLFSWKAIPKMLEIKEILIKASKQIGITEEEKSNLLGESDLILSFLHYNDIAAMSKLHQSAYKQMTRSAISIESRGSYTFGSPSVLMMFHREPGQMNMELETMIKSMPYYNQLSQRQGLGAELIMEAEVFYLRGQFMDAQISLEKARQAALSVEQQYILLCCDFLTLRMTLQGVFPYDREWNPGKSLKAKPEMDSLFLTAIDGCNAYFQGLCGAVDSVPVWIADGKLQEMNLLQPAMPMYELIHNQILLAKGRYVELIGKSERQLRSCIGFSYALCTLHLHIQLVAAYEAIGKRREAKRELYIALGMAIQDGCFIPFVENFQYLSEIFKEVDIKEFDASDAEFIKKIVSYAKIFEQVRKEVKRSLMKAPIGKDLTKTEYRICELIAERKTNREIAQELFFSEGTIKQYINQIYAKLKIPGDPREKRKNLSKLIHHKN